MNRTWHLPFRWISDPDGGQLGRSLDAWNAAERGGLFHPLVLLVAPDGEVLVRHRSRDFADRRDDQDLLVVTENGFGKRTLVGDYRKTSRGAKGVKTIQQTEAKGALAAALVGSGTVPMSTVPGPDGVSPSAWLAHTITSGVQPATGAPSSRVSARSRNPAMRSYAASASAREPSWWSIDER